MGNNHIIYTPVVYGISSFIVICVYLYNIYIYTFIFIFMNMNMNYKPLTIWHAHPPAMSYSPDLEPHVKGIAHVLIGIVGLNLGMAERKAYLRLGIEFIWFHFRENQYFASQLDLGLLTF